MTDRELNEKLAELCGMEVEFMPFDWRRPTPPFPYILECLGHWGLIREGVAQVYWDPVKLWQQVHDYVIPAVHRLPLQVQIIFNPSKTTVVMNNGITPMFLKQTEHNCSSPRLLCELALEAREKLEETSAN